MMKIDWPENAIGMFKPFNSNSKAFFVSSKRDSDFTMGEHSNGFEGEKLDGGKYHVFTHAWEYVERPSPAWSGEGLPPVGTVCEYNASSDRDKGKELWCEVCIKYLSEWVIVFACTKAPRGHEASVGVELFGDISDRIEKRFRPIRTPEQIAADEREADIDAMCADIVEYYGFPKMSEHYLGLAKALHVAGYRKQADK